MLATPYCRTAAESRKDARVLLYARTTECGAGILRRILKPFTPGGRVEYCRTINGLLKRLRIPDDKRAILVLLAESRDDVVRFLSMKHLFFDKRIILILPDKKKDVIALGHRLRPRFMTYLGNDLCQVSAVIEKMLRDRESYPN